MVTSRFTVSDFASSTIISLSFGASTHTLFRSSRKTSGITESTATISEAYSVYR